MNFYATKASCCPPITIGHQRFAGAMGRTRSGFAKMLRIMKLTAFILLIGCLQATAHGVAQDRITFSGDDVTLKKVFTVIKKQTSYLFLYNDELLLHAKKVSINVRNASVEEVLAACLKDQPFDFTIKGKTIFIINKPEPEKKDPPVINEALFDDIKGRITNAQGEPLSGANIVIKRTGKGTQANANGEFVLKGVGPDEVLTITYTGYSPQIVKVNGRTNLILVMNLSDNELDEAVVQGYGTTTRRFATGDIGVVTAKDIEKMPVTLNPLMALQGRVAGLDIQQTSGYASAPIKATIRGLSSVNPEQIPDPLYIVDGVPLTVLNIGKAQNNGTGSYGFLQNAGLIGPANGQSPLFSVNTSDIESITVLKDADATSIYGSRGANGVILITTKSGKPGKTRLNIHVEEGVNMVARYWKMLNTPEYLNMRREALKNDGLTPIVRNAPDLMIWDTTRYTDWQKALYGKAGKVINVQASLTGGNVQTTFRLGASYTHSTAITTASGADQKATVSLNITHHSVDRRFSVTFSNGYSFTKSDMISLPGRINYAPNAPSIFDSSGNLNWKEWNAARSFGATNANPFAILLQPYTAKTNFLNSNMVVGFQPFHGFDVSVSFGFNNAQANQISLIPIASQDPLDNPTGSSNFGNNRNTNWIIEPQINYNAPFGPGIISVLMGGSIQKTITDGIWIYGSGYNNDALLRTISNAPSKLASENYAEYRYAAVFARLGYDIDHKYLMTLNARRDGSSNYGPGNEFGNFASIGAAWIFTEENWFKKKLRFISFGKLQGSYGTTGSDGGIPYGYITRWSSKDLLTYNGVQPLIPTQHANPDYRWQLNRKLEGSISLGFFKDWVTIRAAYYRSRTNNQLLAYPTPMLSGFGTVQTNLPALVQNQGWEFTIGGKGIRTKFFNWAPSINFSFNQNKFVSFPGLGSSPFRNLGMIGQPLNGLYVLHYAGVDPQTGQYTYADRNHDGVISQSYIASGKGDVYFKKINPSIATGFGFNFDVKGFNLALFFNAKKQDGINAISQGSNPGQIGRNQPVLVLARWQKPGDVTNVGKFSTIGAMDPNGYLGNSDIGYTDASYIRLSNLSLTYTFSDSWAKKGGMQSCNLYIRASNIFTITRYKGIDPETQNFGGMPPIRTITGGLSVNF
jgi:TonB-linked SusC/RagA family outer membrane protein